MKPGTGLSWLCDSLDQIRDRTIAAAERPGVEPVVHKLIGSKGIKRLGKEGLPGGQSVSSQAE